MFVTLIDKGNKRQEENIFGVIKRYIQISSSNISAHVVAPSSVKKWRENTKQTDLKKQLCLVSNNIEISL